MGPCFLSLGCVLVVLIHSTRSCRHLGTMSCVQCRATNGVSLVGVLRPSVPSGSAEMSLSVQSQEWATGSWQLGLHAHGLVPRLSSVPIPRSGVFAS